MSVVALRKQQWTRVRRTAFVALLVKFVSMLAVAHVVTIRHVLDNRDEAATLRKLPMQGRRRAIADWNRMSPITGNSLARWPLEEIADNHRRIVVAITNEEYLDFADNFAQSLIRQNVSNFVLVCLDDISYEALRLVYPLQTQLLTHLPTTTGSVRPGSDAFWRLTSLRPAILRAFLEENFSVFYNDIDMVWQKDVWKEVDTAKTTVLWHDGPKQLCSCMMYLSPASLPLVRLWEDEIANHNHKNDQPAFNQAVKSFGGEDTMIHKNCDTFPHGQRYFVDEKHAHERGSAVLVHNNWISGKEKKRNRFQLHGLWNPSGKLETQ